MPVRAARGLRPSASTNARNAFLSLSIPFNVTIVRLHQASASCRVAPALTAGGKTHAAFDRRSIPPEPRRCAPLIVAFRSKYTRYSSLTRLVGRAPRPHRENWPVSALTWVPPQAVNSRWQNPRGVRPAIHPARTASLRAAHRCVSVEIHSVFLPHAPCQPGASPPPGELADLGAHTGFTTGC